MKRLHIHVAVDNLANSIEFYSDMFGMFCEPEKIEPDEAAFCIPPAKPGVRLRADGPCCVSSSAKQGAICCSRRDWND